MSGIVNDVEKAARRWASKVSNGVSCAALEQRINEHYRELGRLYYEAAQRGEAPEGTAPLMTKISQLREELAVKKNI